MRVAVLGATGGTGREVVDQALRAGHGVSALVRRPGALPAHERLRLVVGNVSQHGAVDEVVRGQDVVISALGTEAKGPVTVCADGARAVLTAMGSGRPGRLVALSAHGAAESRDRSLYCLAVWLSVPEKMRDKERMEALIRASDVRWTIVRPPALSNRAHTGAYRTGVDLKIGLTSKVSRADLADFLLREAATPAFTGQTPAITG
jgi:putative NADH-flavin reductase